MSKRKYNKRLIPNNLLKKKFLLTKFQSFLPNQYLENKHQKSVNGSLCVSKQCLQDFQSGMVAETFVIYLKKFPFCKMKKNFESLAPNSLFFLFCTSSIWKKTKTTTIRMHSECHNRLINLVRDLGDYIVYSSLRHWPTLRRIAIPIRKEVALA